MYRIYQKFTQSTIQESLPFSVTRMGEFNLISVKNKDNRQLESNIRATSDRQRVTIYLGTPKSNDLFDSDVKSAISSYIHLIGVKDLAHYPLVFANRAGLESFLEMRKHSTSEVHDNIPVQTNDHDYNTGSRFLYALRNINAYCAEDFIFKQDQKIYIAGHGAPGKNRIVLDKEVFTTDKIAKTLSNIGVNKDTRDFRLTSCYSADVKKITDIAADNLSEYSKDSVETVSILGFKLSELINKAPAAYLVDSLHNNGFNLATVTGYHGIGIYYDGKETPKHSIRSDKMPNPDKSVRRSTVSEQFFSDSSVPGAEIAGEID